MTEAERKIQSPTPDTLHFHLPAQHKKVKALAEYRSPSISGPSADSPLDTPFPSRSIPRSSAPSPDPFPSSLGLNPRELPPLPSLPSIKASDLNPPDKVAALEKQVKALEDKVDELMAERKSDEATVMVDVQSLEIKQESDEGSNFDLWAVPQAGKSPEQT